MDNAVLVRHSVVDAGKGHGVHILRSDSRLNGVGAAVGHIFGQIVPEADIVIVVCAARFDDGGAAVRRRAAIEGMVQLEADAVQEIAEGVLSYLRIILALDGDKREDRFRLIVGNRIPVLDPIRFLQVVSQHAIADPRIIPQSCAVVRACHDPDIPLFRVGDAGRKAEGGLLVLKFAAFGKLCAVENDRLAAVFDSLPETIRKLLPFLLEPVHHPHELISAILLGFAGKNLLIGSDDQRHGVGVRAAAMVEAPLIHAQRLRVDDLVQRALLVRIQLRSDASILRRQGHILHIRPRIFLEQLNQTA